LLLGVSDPFMATMVRAMEPFRDDRVIVFEPAAGCMFYA